MHRAFEPRPVAEGELTKLLWAASRAPTARAGVRQLLVTSRPDSIRLVREACPGFINNAETIVLVFSDLDLAEELLGIRGRELVSRIDSGAAAAYLSLAAPALGLGLCITTSWSESAVREIFGLPLALPPGGADRRRLSRADAVACRQGLPAGHPRLRVRAALAR